LGGWSPLVVVSAGRMNASITSLDAYTPASLLLKVNNRGFEEMLEADTSVREALEAEMARRLERMDAPGGS
jgi:hypothetical protein